MTTSDTNRHDKPLALVVLISGSGTNLQAIIDAIESCSLCAAIKAVISNRPDALGLERAKKHGIPCAVLDHTTFSDRESFDVALQATIDAYAPDWLVLAGYMRLLSTAFVTHFKDRMLNIHPSLLPLYKGLNTHARVLKAGDSTHGCSVHLVTPELDDGPIIAQRRVNVVSGDTVQTLAERVQREEHLLYPQCLQLIASQRLKVEDGQILLDGKTLTKTGIDLTSTELNELVARRI